MGKPAPSSLAEVDVSADHLTGIVLRIRLQERGLEHLATNEKGRAPGPRDLERKAQSPESRLDPTFSSGRYRIRTCDLRGVKNVGKYPIPVIFG